MARLLAALGVALGASLAAPAPLPLFGPAPAAADPCGGADGVTVVVDFNALGGGVEQACVAGGGGTARGLFSRAGVEMEDVRGQDGFICRVEAKPGPETCVRGPSSTQFWSLWWSRGDGRWVFSGEGVNLLDVPTGGFVAWSWTEQAPSASASRPEPEEPPTSGGGSGGNSGGGSGGAGSPGDGPSSGAPSTSPQEDPGASEGASEDPSAGSGTASQGEDEKNKAGKGARKGPKDEAGAKKDRAKKDGKDAREGGGESVDSPLTDEDGDTEQVSSASEEDPAGLPVWVPIAVLVVLAAGGVGAVVWRRRTGGTT